MFDYATFLTNGDFFILAKTARYVELLVTGEQLNDLFLEVNSTYIRLLTGRQPIQFSTNTSGNLHFSETRTKIDDVLVSLDLQTRIEGVFSNCPHRLAEQLTIIFILKFFYFDTSHFSILPFNFFTILPYCYFTILLFSCFTDLLF